MLNVVEEELSEAFHIGFESENDGSKTAFFYFVEQILMEFGQNCALKKSLLSS